MLVEVRLMGIAGSGMWWDLSGAELLRLPGGGEFCRYVFTFLYFSLV